MLADTLNACKNTIVNMEVLPFDLAGKVLGCHGPIRRSVQGV